MKTLLPTQALAARSHAPRLPRALSALAACSAFALAGCAMGPTGEPPAMPQPEHYGAQAQPAQTVAAQGVAQQFVTGAEPMPQWWTLYGSDTLDALVNEGLANSPDLAAADHSLQAAREQLRGQIGSSLLPTVDAIGTAQRQQAPAIPQFGIDQLQYALFAGLIDVRYTFDVFGATRLNNAALASRVNVQAFQFEAARRALAANIVASALGAATLHAQIDTTEQLVALANAQADDVQKRYALGAASRTDLLNAQQSAASLAANLPGLRQQWAAQRHALAVLIGRTPDQAPPDLDLASLAVPPQVPVVVPSELLKTRPDIEAATATLTAAAAEVGAATAQMYPSITLSAALGQGGFSWPVVTSGAGALWAIGASLSQPIFHGGALLAQRRAALQSYDAANDTYKQTVLTAFRDVADRLAALEHDAQALDAASTSARTAQGVYEDTNARYKLGAVPWYAVRQSEQQWRNARLDEIRYRGTRLADTAALFQAMGNPPTNPATLGSGHEAQTAATATSDAGAAQGK